VEIRKRKEMPGERKNYITRSCVFCTLHCTLVGGFSERECMGRACSLNGVDVKCIHDFCQKI
jgi:hypothetical protein